MDSLEQIYEKSSNIRNITNIDSKQIMNILLIADWSFKKKGVYTVLTTLLYYKYLHPEQDVKLHQGRFENGFSARGFDTKFVTPVLKKLGLPAMAESGWLTRSLEQPYPYTKDYNGAIGTLKAPFLEILDYVEKNDGVALNCLRILLNRVGVLAKENTVEITPLEQIGEITIDKIVFALEEHFLHKYETHNAAKLPMLAFYAIYTSLIKEMKRYENCTLGELSSLTASDRTNYASGDIEIFKENKLFEAVEIKLDRKIDSQIVRVVESKIYKWNPCRYYILSVYGIDENSQSEIREIVKKVLDNHGCEIIINGLMPTIKYYLRLISNLKDFINSYTLLVQNDTELQKVHKTKWAELLQELNK